MKKIDELLIGAKCHLRQLIFGKQPGIRAMTTNERIELLHSFYNLGYDETFRFDVREAYRMKRNFINEIVNEELVEERASFRTEKKYGCAYYIRNFPNSSDDDLIPALSNMPCPSIVTVNIKPVDEDVGRSHLKACYMAVQQQINQSQEEKARHGNFTDVFIVQLAKRAGQRIPRRYHRKSVCPEGKKGPALPQTQTSQRKYFSDQPCRSPESQREPIS